LGKPYQVRGKWYYPKEDKSYKKVGAAWYGDAFHGRLTVNGEIYDMTHLTAAHPTMPLPSYARVTNMENGSSVIVRVNDRGPYAHGRIIDLFCKAAEMLDYAHIGIASVKVEYVGRAPLEGRDDQFLLASYRPGSGDPASDGLPTGVMIAMNGPTPNGDIPAPAFPGELGNSGQGGCARSGAFQLRRHNPARYCANRLTATGRRSIRCLGDFGLCRGYEPFATGAVCLAEKWRRIMEAAECSGLCHGRLVRND
jgi:rare lipoprotein A